MKADVERRALYQRFLPSTGHRAFVWKYSEPEGGRRPRHFHSEPELNLVASGWATFGVGKALIRVSAGEMLAFPAAQDHVLLEASPDLYLYAIGLDPSLASDALGVGSEVLAPCHVGFGSDELEVLLDRAASLVERPHQHQLAAELWERANWLASRATPRAGRRAHVLTRRALKLLDAAPELGLEALASKLRAHASEVSRHFHRDVGVPLVRLRMRRRLLRVIRLLDAGERDLMTAATAAGFGSYSQCHRTFQSELGCAPRQFFSELREQMQLTYTR
jgi:AraC-like DNA-binding protein/quercetin dioxygenase-like cupin family protein